MLQTFHDSRLNREQAATRLAALRRALHDQGLDGFLVPRADAHRGEYVPPCSERLAWLTGFTGSAGMAVILPERAAVFADGRYRLQLREQVAESLYEPGDLIATPPHRWLREALGRDQRLGFDPWLHTPADVDRLRAACNEAGAALVPCDANPVDQVWRDRPPPPTAPAVPHPPALAGESAADKLTRIAADLKKKGADAALLTLPDSIAWLFNVRGGDVPRTPFVLSFALIRADGTAAWFVDPAKLNGAVRESLDLRITPESPDALPAALAALGQAGRAVLLDRNSAPHYLAERLRESGARLIPGRDPCQLPKARKNATELSGARAAHRRDGAALTRFLAWLAREAPGGGIDEIGAATRLESFRAESGDLRDLSFDTISAAGPNGAIVHYRVSEGSNRRLEPGTLYLVDSGGQYGDGTTDVTRTVAIGTPEAVHREHFTLVLKGHIALASALFPAGVSGSHLDALARLPLWRAGLDYDHGTGHGVGSFLSVHEGPQQISRRENGVPLEAGMIISNEPGYYREGHYGIRIENLVAVREAETPADGERPMLSFETLTLAPLDRALVESALLTDQERSWLNGYHRRVREEIGPLVDAETRNWLETATAEI